jgi:manganese/zinc/iron transport system permease protein
VGTYDIQVIVAGLLAASSSALLGVYLIVRRLTLLADAISHAILPGIVLGFFIAGTRDTWAMLAGAALAAVACTSGIEFLTNRLKLQADLSIGLIFTFFFALGVILISIYAEQVDLDQECVLYGELAYAPLDVIRTGSGLNIGPKAIWLLGLNLAATLGFIIFCFRELCFFHNSIGI